MTAEKEIRDSNDKYNVLISAEPTSEGQRMIIGKIKENVFGQDRAIRRAVRAISIFEANLNDPRRPVGCFMLPGHRAPVRLLRQNN